MTKLPHCDELFLRFFDRWYDEEDRKRRGFEATRPDMLRDESLVGLTANKASPLTEESRQEVCKRIGTMFKAAGEDWPRYLHVEGEPDVIWIDAFDRYYDRKRIKEVIKKSDPVDFANDYLVLSCEFGAVLGYVMRSLESRLIWRLEWPYWESALLDPKTGNLIPVFHWAVKKLSEYGVDDCFAEKVEASLQILQLDENDKQGCWSGNIHA